MINKIRKKGSVYTVKKKSKTTAENSNISHITLQLTFFDHFALWPMQ